jgi:hypothetical protein
VGLVHDAFDVEVEGNPRRSQNFAAETISKVYLSPMGYYGFVTAADCCVCDVVCE